MTGTTTLTAGVATDVGRVRSLNEDNAFAATTLFVVADGMGGHAAGEVASEIAVRTVGGLEGSAGLRLADIVGQVDEANRRILRSAAEHPTQSGMGTTLAGLAVIEVGGSPHWAVFNIGDSRVYRLTPGGDLEQVTVDHSEVQELVDAGWITAEEARVHPARNVVTRSLGRDPMGAVDTWVFPQEAGERFLVCSDGLSNEVSALEIRGVLREVPDVASAATSLVALAREHGGRDNITAIVVALGGAAPVATVEPHDVDADDVDDETMPRGQVRNAGW